MENQLTKRSYMPEIRAVEAQSRTWEFVISTESVDTYRTVWKMDGWDLEQYRQNPVVAYNHYATGPNPDTIIGTSEVRKEGNQLVATLILEEGNPIADRVQSKLEKGILRGASIGAIPMDGHWGKRSDGEDPDVFYFTKQRLMEWSVVSIPSNPDAFKRSAGEESFIRAIEKPKETTPSAVSLDDYDARLFKLKFINSKP